MNAEKIKLKTIIKLPFSFLLLTALIGSSIAIGQEESPKKDASESKTSKVAEGTSDPSKADVPGDVSDGKVISTAPEKSTKELIKESFALSKSARSISDFEKLIETLDLTAKRDDLTQTDSKNSKKLGSWARYMLAKKTMLSAGDYKDSLEEVVEICGSAIELNKNDYRIFRIRGVALTKLNRLAESIEDFDAAIRLKPKNADLWFNRAEVRYAKKDYALAAGDYTEVIELAPKDAHAFNGRAHCYMKMNQVKLALVDYQEVSKLRLESPVALINLADAQQVAGNWTEAEQNYTEALERNTKSARAWRRLAWLMATRPDDEFTSLETAEECIKKAFNFQNDQAAENFDVLAAIQAAKGDFKLAKESQKQAIKLATESQKPEMTARLELYEKQRPYLQSETINR